MVGLTPNCSPGLPVSPHLQSMILALDQVGLALIRPLLVCFPTMLDAVISGEVSFTRSILEGGYNVEPLISQNRRFKHVSNHQFWQECRSENVWDAFGYDQMDIHPFDAM